jgi:hypothetical protein
MSLHEEPSEEYREPASAVVHIEGIEEEFAPRSQMDAARYYAGRGLPVFPCNPLNKAPLIGRDKDADDNPIEKTGGLYKATTNIDQVRAWWTMWPNAMIGIPMGEVSGVWAIDPDAPKEPGDPDGPKNWEELQRQHGFAPRTHTHDTPGGGQHHLYRYRPDKPVTNTEGALKGLGINVRGNGGYVIFPPSANAEGKDYVIADPEEFFNFAEAPDFLYDMVLAKETASTEAADEEEPAPYKPTGGSTKSRRRYAEAALQGECKFLSRMAKGSQRRNIELNNSALKLGTLVASGDLTESEVRTALFSASVHNGLTQDPNCGPRGVRDTISSGLRKGMQTPRIIPDRGHACSYSTSDEATAGGEPSGAWPLKHAKDFRTNFTKEWIIKGVLAPGEVSTWCGPPGKGKSGLAGDISLHVAAGRDWRGYRSKQKGAVVYFALERADLVERRFSVQAGQYELKFQDLPFSIVNYTIDMMDLKCVDRFITTIRAAEEVHKIPIKLIVIDTSSKAIAAGGGEENAAKDKNMVRANARRVMSEIGGLHVAFVSHTGKDEKKGERGSNAGLGDDDIRIMLDGVNAIIDKCNDGPEGLLTNYKMMPVVLGKDEDGDEISIAIIDPDTTPRAASIKTKPKGQPGMALDFLVEAINEVGAPPPDWLELPKSVRNVVRVEQWEEQCRKRRLAGGKGDAFRKAFDRAADKLQELRLIAILDDYVWIVYE